MAQTDNRMYNDLYRAWDFMVDDHEKNHGRNSVENKKVWRDFLYDSAFFGYSRIFDEVGYARKMRLGEREIRTPYFFVRDSISEDNLFVVDVQRYDVNLGEQDLKQLRVCLRYFDSDFGIFVGDKISVLSMNEGVKQIPFSKINPDGVDFLKRFSRASYGAMMELGQNETITKSVAIAMFSRYGYKLDPKTTTFASLNSSINIFWANPNVNLLKKDWYIIFNDTSTRRLYLAFIPANTIMPERLKVRADRPYRIDLAVAYAGGRFIDTRSGFAFGEFIVCALDYTGQFVNVH